MTSIEDRYEVLLGGTDGFNQQKRIWKLRKREQQIEFGSIPNLGDERKYQGRPHDLLAFDEATNVFAEQVRFMSTWLRSTVPGQPAELLLTFNPPVDAKGRWVMSYFAPWLETETAVPGEIRYFITVDTKDVEVSDERERVIIKGEPVTEFNREDYEVEDILEPQSRTFIPARVKDNTYLGRQYMTVLQGLPEPLRSQMLKGDFSAGIEDDEWQVIKTDHVRAAMERWKKTPLPKKPEMDSLGVDVARGGRDSSVIARRHGMWFDELLDYPGAQTPTGYALMALVIAAIRDKAPVHIDVVGVGSSPYDFLRVANFQTVPVNGAEKTNERTVSGTMGFANVRSLIWWRLAEALDPDYNTGIMLPPDKELERDLTSVIWKPEGTRIRVETRQEIIKRIGHSPDRGTAVALALIQTPKRHIMAGKHGIGSHDYDPMASM